MASGVIHSGTARRRINDDRDLAFRRNKLLVFELPTVLPGGQQTILAVAQQSLCNGRAVDGSSYELPAT